jgi:Tol biopolymer transport system component
MDNTDRGAADPEPLQDEVRAALKRVLASTQFSKASQQCRFLSFVVEESLQNRGADLKEYTIGRELRGDSFDGDTDTTVRVQAANIRRKLAEYYEGPGADDPLLIEIPRPGYVPVFRYRRAPAREDATQALHRPIGRPGTSMLAGAGVVLTIAAAMAFWFRGSAKSVREPMRLVQLTQDSGKTGDPAVSRDGRLLAFSSNRAETGGFAIWIRELNGGEARRLTRDPAIAQSPDISPDARNVVFRSFRDGGGIYMAPVAGGIERRIADGGFDPRFSPDGAWIAYARIERQDLASIYVVPSSGGEPRRIQSQDLVCSCPLWTPDGKAIQFAARSDSEKDWWLVPFDPSVQHPVPAKSSGLLAAMHRQRMSNQDSFLCNRDWLNNDLVLGSGGGLLRVGTKPDDWSVQGPITQILPAVGLERLRVVREPSGKASVVYTSTHNQTHIWAVPLTGQPSASEEKLRLLVDAPGVPGIDGSRPSVSSDGTFLVFSDGADPATQVRLYDLKRGTKTQINRGITDADRAVISRDGAVIALQQHTARSRAIYRFDTAEPDRIRQICGDCGVPLSWSPSRRSLLYLREAGLWLLDVETGSSRALLRRARYEVFQASFSPDGQRIALVVSVPGKAKIQGVIMPFDGNPGADSSWTPIAEESYELSMEWAADGDLIYYFNLRDGRRCLWGQRLDRSGLKRAGDPFAVRHFHDQRLYPLYGSWIAPARDFIALNLTEGLANIYELDLP